jgi:aminomethyltransferase
MPGKGWTPLYAMSHRNWLRWRCKGPHSRAILKQLIADVDWDRLSYFRLAQGALDGRPVSVTRTGYTGDLGYELWVAPALAESLWDRIMAAGADYGLLPVGMAALDVARIEAGLPLVEVDYISAYDALLEGQKSSPFELGLGWAVALDGGEFIGKAALQAEKAGGARWAFTGLQVDWFELERLVQRGGAAAAGGGQARLAIARPGVQQRPSNRSGHQPRLLAPAQALPGPRHG